MTNGILLPGLGGPDHGDMIRKTVAAHNLAIASLTPAQAAAVQRLVTATALTVAMVGDAPPDVQRGCAQEALAEVLRREAFGQPSQTVMWAEATLETTDDMIDRLAAASDRETNNG